MACLGLASVAFLFALAVLIALGPSPAKGIKCRMCGGNFLKPYLKELRNDAIQESEHPLDESHGRAQESEEYKAALKKPCSEDGKSDDLVDCAAFFADNPPTGPQREGCAKFWLKDGRNIVRFCAYMDPGKDRCRQKFRYCDCVSNNDGCNDLRAGVPGVGVPRGGGGDSRAAPSLSPKFGPLIMMGLTVLPVILP